jgi:N-acyl-D-aspartate/D-glutamate deacylase
MLRPALGLLVALLAWGADAAEGPALDVAIRGGTLYDGTGGAPRRADVGLRGDRIVALGDLAGVKAKTSLDARGLAVAPGFINMLSWSNESLLADGRSQSEIRQGVTTEIFGEGWSMGPVNDVVRRQLIEDQVDIRFDVTWTTLAEYLALLERQGIAPNVASFVGATTVREHVIGLADRKATPQELERMRGLVRQAMQQGALGVGSSLIYAPATYADTDELIALAKVAAEYRGMYISHIRNEGDRLREAVAELVRISREAGLPAEIYHLKAAGDANWPKLDQVIEDVERARREGLRITADMYTYTAGATGFNACLPGWAQDGGYDALFQRIQDPPTRERLLKEMRRPGGYENLCRLAGSPDRILLLSFKSDALKPLAGKTLAEVARLRGTDPESTILDLMLEDRSRVGTAFFLMSEDNVRKQIRLPWVSFGCDEASQAPEGVFLKSLPHPRAYGTFARLLGRYVREEKVISLAEAVRRLSGLPATNLGLEARGFVKQGMFADLVVFDPATIADHATYANPRQYATGVRHVFVNGVAVLKDGEHTGATPGRALKGRGAVSR